MDGKWPYRSLENRGIVAVKWGTERDIKPYSGSANAVHYCKEASPSPAKTSPDSSPLTSPRQRRDSDRYCQLCNAWFNNPGMAQQHYDGKKHKKNASRADLLQSLGKTLDRER
ncbi:hypothetical protein F7725_012210 [Dissostichus mawsoni]|uniref:Matrin-type domain-containing protein n=1 Tax=Dissostichus mawsoni TaxID=36200 RepID=A0A7J5YQ85_DISMA|nr:hypothetical protein F7725_012210 [Dissostichus mawsoni]